MKLHQLLIAVTAVVAALVGVAVALKRLGILTKSEDYSARCDDCTCSDNCETCKYCDYSYTED